MIRTVYCAVIGCNYVVPVSKESKLSYVGYSHIHYCRACKTETEMQEHVLEKCKVLHISDSTRITRNCLFIEKLKNTARDIKDIMKRITEEA